MLEPVSVALQFGFLAVLYLFLLWISRSALRDLRRPPTARGADPVARIAPTELPDATGLHPASQVVGSMGNGEPRLIVERAPGHTPGMEYDIGQGAVLGRGDQAEIRLEDPFASSRHARLVLSAIPRAIPRAIRAPFATPSRRLHRVIPAYSRIPRVRSHTPGSAMGWALYVSHADAESTDPLRPVRKERRGTPAWQRICADSFPSVPIATSDAQRRACGRRRGRRPSGEHARRGRRASGEHARRGRRPSRADGGPLTSAIAWT